MVDRRKDRAMGAIIGSLIGDSIGRGCHWYYNTEEQERDCGTWISDYQDPSPSRQDIWGKVSKLRYDLGLRSGDVSQTGEFSVMLIESLYENGGVYKLSDVSERVN
jgi:ADP-ribosylglycohydrolase